MKTKTAHLIVTALLVGSACSCATTAVPGQLALARSSYAAESTGLTANLAPRELSEAKQVLDQADQEFARNGDTGPCRDYSYIAENKVELAEAVARAALDRQAIGESVTYTPGAAPSNP